MKSDLSRTQTILNRDRMVDVSALSDIISNEVAQCLSNFFNVNRIKTKIKVLNNGELDILIGILSNYNNDAKIL